MPLIYSPVSDEPISHPPTDLFPKHAFIMRQLGEPSGIDILLTSETTRVLTACGYKIKDADASTGAKDFLGRILGLIRGTAITVAIFSGDTRPTALANIMLELGFAAMCGKPLMIVKSKGASAPSDLTRTDWIQFEPTDVPGFERKIRQAVDEVDRLARFEEALLDLALDAESMDCAVALERALRCFLLTGDALFIDKADTIRSRLHQTRHVSGVGDLNRLSDEASLIVRLGRRYMQA